MSELEEFFKTMGRTQKAWEEFERLRAIEAAAREVVSSHSGESSAIDFANVSLRKLNDLRKALEGGPTRE